MVEETHVIQVLIVHEYPLMCNIISRVIDGEPDIQVKGYASSVKDTVEFVLREPIDIVLISPRLPENGSVQLTKILMKKAPSVRILILGISETREQVLEYIEAGASGYIVRESSVDDLLSVIRAAHEGEALISPKIASALIHRVRVFTRSYMDAGISLPDLSSLTARELEILRLLGQNCSNQEIADRLVIGRGTVKNHVHNIFDKLGITNRQEAAELYIFHTTNSSHSG